MPATSDLVHETTTGTGTGNLDLVNENGKRSFNTAFGNGAPTNVFDYFISNRAAAEWERGTGHMSDSDTLVRDTVLASSNAGAAVNFSAGTKDVTNDEPAAAQGYRGHRLGTATNDAAAAGEEGEYSTNSASAVSLSTGTNADVTSVSLTAGDWDVAGFMQFNPAGTTVLSAIQCAINTTSATFPSVPGEGRFLLQGPLGTGLSQYVNTGVKRISISSTTTVYLVGLANFTTSTCTAHGFIRARRVR